jgi:RNA polymerase sigma-70 factor (ECF subfamily)
MMNPTDEELVKAVRGGDREAFGPLVQRYQQRAVAVASHLLGDCDEAEDLAQEAFVEAYLHLARLREPAKFKSWLLGILHHQCLKHLRRRRRQPLVISLDDPRVAATLATPGPAEAMGRDLLALLERLPENYREVLVAKYLEERTYEEIAALLGLTVNNVYVRVSRAKEKLWQLMAEEDAATAQRPPPRLGVRGER